MHLLLGILQPLDPSTLENFLGKVPMKFNVVILSHHGFFRQANGFSNSGGKFYFQNSIQFVKGVDFRFYMLSLLDGKNLTNFKIYF